ncbi:MAG: FG-GAP repeat protein [Ferruginibacter sp.]
MASIFGEKLSTAAHYKAWQIKSVLPENTGSGIIAHPLLTAAQWHPVYSITITDVNNDDKMDLVIGGMESYSRI